MFIDIKMKLKDNKGGMAQIIAAIIVFLSLFSIYYVMMFSEPYFSDKRVTREYVDLAKDMICRQPKKGDKVKAYLNNKLEVIYGKDKFNVSYYIKKANNDWQNAIEITGSLNKVEYERGDLLVVYFQRKDKSFFENAIGKNFSKVIASEGMIEADTE